MATSLILYPRSYNQRGGEHLHSVMGVTPEGLEVNVKLRLDEGARNRANAPSISEFAREDRKARQACIASPNNGPEHREGVLLFTQVSRDTLHRGPMPAYIAKWAVVLAEDNESPDPLFGWGRLSIIRDAPERLRLARLLKEAELAGKDTTELTRSFSDGEHLGFQAIVYRTDAITRHPADHHGSVAEALAEAVDSGTRMGVAGGALIRLRNASNKVASGASFELLPRFLARERRLQNGQEVAEEARSRIIELPAGRGDSVDVVPLVRIHSGPRGNQYYALPERFKAVIDRYEAYDGSPSVCRVAVRLSVFEDTQNTLLSRIYAISHPVGAPDQLEDHGICLPYDDPAEESQNAELLPVVRMGSWAELGRSILATPDVRDSAPEAFTASSEGAETASESSKGSEPVFVNPLSAIELPHTGEQDEESAAVYLEDAPEQVIEDQPESPELPPDDRSNEDEAEHQQPTDISRPGEGRTEPPDRHAEATPDQDSAINERALSRSEPEPNESPQADVSPEGQARERTKLAEPEDVPSAGSPTPVAPPPTGVAAFLSQRGLIR